MRQKVKINHRYFLIIFSGITLLLSFILLLNNIKTKTLKLNEKTLLYKEYEKKKKMKFTKKSKIYKIKLFYWHNITATYFIFEITKNSGELHCSDTKKVIIENENDINDIINTINTFFVEKTKPLAKKIQTKNEYEITDYPELKIEVYLTDNRIIKNKIQIGDEKNIIYYDSDFERLLKILKLYINKCDIK